MCGAILQVLVLCFAVFVGSWSPSSLNVGYGSSSGRPVALSFSNPQLVKPSPMMGPQLEGARVEAYCTPPSEWDADPPPPSPKISSNIYTLLQHTL